MNKIILFSNGNQDYTYEIKKHLEIESNVKIFSDVNSNLLSELDEFDYSVIFLDNFETYKKTLSAIWLFYGTYEKRSFIIAESEITKKELDNIPSDILQFEWSINQEISSIIKEPCLKIIDKIISANSIQVKTSSINNSTTDLESLIDKKAEWTLFLEIENEKRQLAELTELLRKPKSENGMQKKFTSGFAYWGLGPTLAWDDAVNDKLYVTMNSGIQNFSNVWTKIQKNSKEYLNFHYVSLGSGTGEKDRAIYSSLVATNPNVRYFPIDLTKQMLNLAVNQVTKNNKVRSSKILPIKTNFSKEIYQDSIREILDKLLNKSTVLFGLLGNTIANFEDDKMELENIVNNLMNKDDFLLLELAHTNETHEEYLLSMKSEYESTDKLRNFHTSALLQNTDLDINNDWIDLIGNEISGEKLELKIAYRNKSNEKKVVKILGDNQFIFEKNDTIRLYLTRKYTDKGIDMLISGLPLQEITQVYSNNDPASAKKKKFGLVTILLKKK